MDVLKERYASPEAGSRFGRMGDFEVHHRVEGPEGGYPVVLIHGVSSSLHTWDGWTARLVEEGFKVIRFDAPGFGLTLAPVSGWDSAKPVLDQLLEGVEAIVDTLVGQDAEYAVAGSSLGGMHAWNLAHRQPARVSRIVLLDPAGYHLPKLPTVVASAGLPGASVVSRVGVPRAVLRRSVGSVYGDRSRIDPATMLLYCELAQAPGNAEATLLVFRSLIAANERERAGVDGGTGARVRRIECPVQLFWGLKDTWLTPAKVEDWKRDVPPERLEVVLYDDVGHVPMEEVPERSVRDAIRFLGEAKRAAVERQERDNMGATHEACE